MRILLISNMYPTEKNPAYGVFVKNFELGMRAHGVLFDLAVIQGKPQGKIAKIHSYSKFILNIYIRIFSKKYDVIYIHFITHSLLPLIFIAKHLKTLGTKIICNAHGEDLAPSTKKDAWLFSLARNTIAKSNLIVVPSKYFEGIAKKKLPNTDIFVSPSAGINLDLFKPTPGVKRTRTMRIGYVSRVDPGKGWDILAKAIKSIKSTHPHIKLQVEYVGDGSEVDFLKKTICDFGLQEIVTYLGSMPQSDLPAFYTSLDAFIFPTTLPESLGLVGLEALACGVPAICSDIGGIQGYMRDGINGFLFAPGNHDELAKRIIKIYELDDRDFQSLKIAARQTALPYSQDSVSLALYEKIISITEKTP